MTGLFEAAWVIARRDFLATVYSKAFIIFMLTPVLLFGFVFFFGQMQGRADREAMQSRVALLMDSADVEALSNSRNDLASATSQLAFPIMTGVPVEQDVEAQARGLLTEDRGSYSGALMGSLDAPVLVGPQRAEEAFGTELRLVIERARSIRALADAGRPLQAVALERIETANAAGNLRSTRHQLARSAQVLIFMVTMMLATVLVSNFIEEKSNKIIEVLAAAVPLDAIFLGKLLATLAVSVLGLALWGGLAGLAYLFLQVVQDWVQVPIAPAIGWPAFLILVPLYFAANFLLFGAVFLGIGSQASNAKEVQTISVPVVMAQVLVLLLGGMTVSGQADSWVTWFAYIFPLSSPIAMVAYGVQSDLLWPHLLALAWQAVWVFIFIRVAAGLFRRFVMKSDGPAKGLGLMEWLPGRH